jgi:predicted AAA+ superfamily ATPase
MLGQLTDAGNTTTLAHYAKILESAFLLSGLELYKTGEHKRGTSPKLVMWNNALIHSVQTKDFDAAQNNPEWWGYIVENAVGAHILNNLLDVTSDLYYWRQRDDEVDFVLSSPNSLWGIEVKSSRMKNPKGLGVFMRRYPRAKPFIVGGNGMPLEDFFLADPKTLFV